MMSDSGPGLAGLPKRIGRYEPTGVLGAGGMGRVLSAHDPVLRREVALKLVEPLGVAAAELRELRFMFHREARTTAALRHPNIIEVLDYSGPDAELPYLACELIGGPTLRELLDSRGRMSVPFAVACAHELASALAHAHDRGIVHRDLKPENVFCAEGGRIVLADFGIAKAFAGNLRLEGTIEFGKTNVYGSPSYMAPEQATGEVVGAPADLFALGSLLFELLTGTPAFDGPDVESILNAVIEGRRAPLPREVATPFELVALIDALHHADATARPSAAAVAERLRSLLDQASVSDPRRLLATQDAAESTAGADQQRDEPNTAMTWAEGGTLSVSANETGPARLESAGTEILRGEELPAPTQKAPLPRRARRPRVAFTLVAAGVALALGAATAFYVWPRRVRPPASRESLAPAQARAAEVTVAFAGQAELWVDGNRIGSGEGLIRAQLPPGEHRLELRSGAQSAVRDVLVLPGSAPVFRFEL